MQLIASNRKVQNYGKNAFVVSDFPKQNYPGTKRYNSVALSRTAGQNIAMTFNSFIGSDWSQGDASKIYFPQSGLYVVSAFVSSPTATAHYGTLQLYLTSSAANVAHNKLSFPAGSATTPNRINVAIVTYFNKGDSLVANWGASQAVSSNTGQHDVYFSAYLIG